MERRFHMKIFRLFHAQRAELRPMGAALGLGAGQPKLLNYLSVHGSCMRRMSQEVILSAMPTGFSP